MTRTSKTILSATRDYTYHLLSNLPGVFHFHNLSHTLEVVDACEEIATSCRVEYEAREIVLIAAWFHDTGFSISPFNHEDHSIQLACEFLYRMDFPPCSTEQVLGCIRATQLPQYPTNTLEEILCDADMVHLSKADYWIKCQLLKQELQDISHHRIREDMWCYENLNFLSRHEYHTGYGKKVLGARKRAFLGNNIEQLESLTRHD